MKNFLLILLLLLVLGMNSSNAQTSTPESVKMVYVEGGTFTMGCTAEQSGDCDDDEKPAHQVTVSSFRMSATEITNAQYAEFLNTRSISGTTYNGNRLFTLSANLTYTNGKWNAKSGYDTHPMVNVTWHGAYEYCNWAGGRLPTEAEWEYAARGGNKSYGYKYAGSNTLDEVAWYSANSGNHTHEVGTKKANELSIYDMSGNVYEWCSDWYGAYNSDAQYNPNDTTSGSYRVFRGGSWNSNAKNCRVTYRYNNTPAYGFNFLGFRLVIP